MLLSEKIAYIAEQIKEAPSTRFIIGAGASYSANVPLSDQMIRLIADKHPACFARLPEDDRTDYGKVMRTLDRAQRERFLIPLLENAKINWGQIALAALFKHKHVSTVLTFNFDLILEKASGLLGMQIPVYDFGFAPTERVGGLATPSIVHLHGQSFGLVLLNTEKETQKHQAALEPILKDTVQNHLTIVFGYSGENDSALETITDQYDSSRRLLWLGHSEDMPQHLQGLMDQEDAEYFGGMDFDTTMIELAMALDAWPPGLVTNPMTHLLAELEPVTDYPCSDNVTYYDILSPMRAKLEELAGKWDLDEHIDELLRDLLG